VYARIATFEGGDAAGLDAGVEATRKQIDESIGSGSPPPGLEGVKGAWILVERESGRSLGITFFETEEDLRRGDEALNAMSPGSGEGRRTDVAVYEVALRREFG
jgi:hypothetical protein